MSTLGRQAVRWFVLVAVVLSVCVLSAAAAAPVHGHAGISSDACNLCQFSHLPLEGGSQGPSVWPPRESVDPLLEFAACSHSPAVEGVTDGRAPPLG